VTDAFEPGSTFKIVTAAAALEAGVVRPEDIIDCENGRWQMPGGVLRDHEPLGRVPFAEVIAKSSNVGTAKVALRLGDERLTRAIASFGFGKKTGIDLGGEAPGRVPPPSRWSKRSAATISIGQELMVTPVQLAAAYAAVANGGRLVKPHLVVRVGDHARGDRATPSAEAAGPRVMSERTAAILTGLLEQVVGPGGTGAPAAVDGVSVAGKTGTAEQVDPETGRYSFDREVASFVGFVPSRAPAVVIAVVLDDPRGRVWGGTAAGPVFARVAEATLRYLNAPRETPSETPTGVTRVAWR
jgi:cell division protein FtsI (penicillin-binding protein 3)